MSVLTIELLLWLYSTYFKIFIKKKQFDLSKNYVQLMVLLSILIDLDGPVAI